jgi:hypothetical protein
MNESSLVSRRQTRGHFSSDEQDVRKWQGTHAAQTVFERFAVQKLHRQERHASVICAGARL